MIIILYILLIYRQWIGQKILIHKWRININFMVFNEDNKVNKVSLFVSFIFNLNQTIIMNNFKTRIIDKKIFQV